MDSKGSSLPSMPELANPISMKQPPESLSVRKGRGDMGSDPAMLMDKAAAQLAATLQDGVLQKMAGHSHNNHSHERLKDLTSRVLNGDQDTLPKLCAPEPPMLKGAEAPATNGTHQHNCPPHTEPEPELKVMIPQVVQQPLFEPCCANGTSLSTVTEGTLSGPDKREDVKKRRGRPHKPKPQSSLSPSASPVESADHTFTVEGTGAADELDLMPELTTEETTDVSPLLIRFSVGDVVWTKVSGYPWWPCIVTTDPEFNNHIKQKAASSRSGFFYHVQYFGDAPERGYIFEKNIVSFTGEDQYQELSQGNKQPASRVIHKKTAPSVPRKLQAQWNMGIIQAKEALSLSLDERMTNFTYLYDDDGPHLNPHILDKLEPEAGSEMSQETESRLSPDVPSMLTGPDSEPAAAPRPPGSTSAGQKTQAPRTKLKMGEWQKRSEGHLNNALSKKNVNATDSSEETFQPQSASQDPTTSAPDIQAESVEPLKTKRRSKQAQSPPKTVGRRNKPATDNNTSDPANKRKSKIVSSTDDILEPVSLPVSVPGKRQRKKSTKRPLADASVEKEPQPQKRRRTSKNAEKQESTSEGTEKKQRRRKKTDKDVKVTKKRVRKSKAALADDQDAEKPKRRRKRKQDGENQVTPSKAKKRRSSPCPEPEGSGSEGRPDSPSDSLDGIKKGERKKEFVCQGPI